jgi:hypothetical protein
MESAMKEKRQSDADQSLDFARVNTRTFTRDGNWFFSSREGDMGPYATESEALEQAGGYVMLVDLKEEDESPVTPDVEDEEVA